VSEDCLSLLLEHIDSPIRKSESQAELAMDCEEEEIDTLIGNYRKCVIRPESSGDEICQMLKVLFHNSQILGKVYFDNLLIKKYVIYDYFFELFLEQIMLPTSFKAF